MIINFAWGVVGLVVGMLIGIMIENTSANKYLKKSQTEIQSRNEVIKNLTRQVNHLRHDRI
jgi:uncharacterized membrane-anchored protein YhcB (DUF1043 family)